MSLRGLQVYFKLIIILCGLLEASEAGHGPVQQVDRRASCKEISLLLRKGQNLVDFELIFNCPDFCHCPSAEQVDCSSADLVSVPKNISKQTTYLKLDKNRLQFLSSECFFECPLILTLDLHDNELTDGGVTSDTFTPLTNLRHLYLADNKLESIPSGLPHSLVTLHLAGNAIKRIDPEALALNRRLRQLYLHNNHIRTEGIRAKVFRALSNLEEVTLSNNDFVGFPPVPSAELIYLQNNSISSIPEGVFRRSRKVRLLYLQKNNICDGGIARKSFAGLRRIEYLDLSENNFTTIPAFLPPKLRRVHLEKNKIRNVTRSSLQRLKRIESLILHHNNIRSVGIESGAFSQLNRLRTLHIYRNDLTTVPGQLPKKLLELILLSNKIRTIETDTFNTSRKLRHLDIRYNKLTNQGIKNGALRKAKSLEFINLSGNRLKAVPVLPRNLTRLFLTTNRINRIPHDSLSRIPQLEHLSLANNRLQNKGIPLYVFVLNKNLKTLDLSKNYLTTVPKFLPINIENLYLHRNLIESITVHAFKHCHHLKIIDLRDNQLLPETAPKEAFAKLPKMRRIYIDWRPKRPHEVKKTDDKLQRRKRSPKKQWRRLCPNNNPKCLKRKSLFHVGRRKWRHGSNS